MTPPDPGGRLFFGVAIGDAAREALAAALGGRLESDGLRVVPERNWHLTIRFLGSVEASAAAALAVGMREAELPPAFELRLAGLGAFPNPARGSILWAGVGDGADALSALAAPRGAHLCPCGVSPRAASFPAAPHARSRSPPVRPSPAARGRAPVRHPHASR